jgi:PAS domain S-box-containing protein
MQIDQSEQPIATGVADAEELLHLRASALEAAANPILITSRAGEIVWVNKAFEQLSGYTRQEALGQSTRLLKSGQQSPSFYREMWDTVLSGNIWRGELINRRKDGSLYHEEMTITPVRRPSGEISHFIAIKLDITERKRTEDRICRLAQAVENSAELIAIADCEGRISFANRALLQATGFGEHEVVGKLFSVLLSPRNPPALGQEMVASSLLGGGWRGECLHTRKDGSDFPVFLSTGPIKDGQGSLIGVFGIAQDITHRKHLEEQLVVAQKMEAVGRLAGGIAHDFNNLLGVILGYNDLLLERIPQGQESHQLEQIKKAGERAVSLTRQLLAFSRKQVFQPRVLDLNLLVADIDKMLRRMIGEDVELLTDLKPGLAHIKADQGQIEQVIMNLVVNSRDAMPTGGKITIETANAELDEAYCWNHPAIQPGRYVLLSVSDTGVGMNAETQAHIFEPFFTTKELGKGTGLGLATVYGVVKQSEGYIWVYSEPSQGTTFKIYFPVASEPVEALAQPHANAETFRGSESVLLVEDAESLRGLATEFLERCGYKVQAATNGPEALQAAERNGEHIDLLLTDVVLPGMSGKQLADCLAVTRPGLRVLFMSGYTNDAIVHHGVLDSGVFFLEKPFSQQTLLRKVREVLDHKQKAS